MIIKILLRILIPIVTIALFVRALFQLLGKKKNLTDKGTPYPGKKKGKNDPDVIDVCPECGNVKGPFHKCFGK